MRFSCLLQFHNSSRGGELRHTMWSGKRGAKWDKHLELLAWGWIESKGIKSYPLACIPHACNYDMCMVHGLAVYCLDAMFFVNLSPFVGTGHLTPVLPALLASLIQYFDKILTDGCYD
jgi:hypothetical protein